MQPPAAALPTHVHGRRLACEAVAACSSQVIGSLFQSTHAGATLCCLLLQLSSHELTSAPHVHHPQHQASHATG